MLASIKPGDKVLIAVLLVAIMGGAAWWALSGGTAVRPGAAETRYRVVTQTKDGQRRVDALDGELEFTIETPGTGTGADADMGENDVRISRGTVDVTASNCSNQICAEHDPISQPGEQIVCLPHGVVIEIVEREEDASRLT